MKWIEFTPEDAKRLFALIFDAQEEYVGIHSVSVEGRTMKYAYLGRTGMKVSKLCLGTWNFGTYTSEQEAFKIMDAALEAGINFFDTANHYPDFVKCGKSEEMIGRWFASGRGRREKVVLATKFYQPMMNDVDGPMLDAAVVIAGDLIEERLVQARSFVCETVNLR